MNSKCFSVERRQTLDGPLEESLAGLAGRHAVVVPGRHVAAHQTQPLGERAQGVLAPPASAAARGPLLHAVAALLLEVASQRGRVQGRGVTPAAVPSRPSPSSPAATAALGGVGGRSAGARPPAAAPLWAAGLCLDVEVRPALPGRHGV